MSLATLTPNADDFDAWENELATEQRYRPTKAAQRRAGKEQILRDLGIRRHRTSEREA